MNKQLKNNKVIRAEKLIYDLRRALEKEETVLAFIVYGSYSDKSDHSPTEYSDVDLEIIIKDEAYVQFLGNFRNWFETKFDPILLETSVGHLNKIFLTDDFLDLQFHISKFSDFGNIKNRQLNYFPNGYTLFFDKSNSLDKSIRASLEPSEEKSPQEKFNRLNNSFWYFVQGTTPYLKRKEYWFAAAGYWFWMYMTLCKLLRMYYKKEVDYNPMKHIEQALDSSVLKRIQPLRNLETPKELKANMSLLVNIYSEYAHRISKENNLIYDLNLESSVIKHIQKYLEVGSSG